MIKRIETGADRLLALIESHKRITLTSACEIIGTSRATLESYLEILEDHGLVEIEIKLNEIIIKAIDQSKSKKKIEETTVSYIEDRIGCVRSKVKVDYVRFKPAEEKINQMSKTIAKNLKDISEAVKEIESIQKNVDRLNSELLGMTSKLDHIVKDYTEKLKIKQEQSQQIVMDYNLETIGNAESKKIKSELNHIFSDLKVAQKNLKNYDSENIVAFLDMTLNRLKACEDYCTLKKDYLKQNKSELDNINLKIKKVILSVIEEKNQIEKRSKKVLVSVYKDQGRANLKKMNSEMNEIEKKSNILSDNIDEVLSKGLQI